MSSAKEPIAGRAALNLADDNRLHFETFDCQARLRRAGGREMCAALGGDVIKASWGGWFYSWLWSWPGVDKNLTGFASGAIWPAVLVLSDAVLLATVILLLCQGLPRAESVP